MPSPRKPGRSSSPSALAQARDPRTPPDALARLASRRDRDVQRLVARNPNAPADVLLSLSARFPEEAAHNPALDLLLLERPDLLSGLSWKAQRSLASLPTLPDGIARALFASARDDQALVSLARSQATAPDLLSCLAAHASRWVRASAAANPSTPAEAVALLVSCGSEPDLSRPRLPSPRISPEQRGQLEAAGPYGRRLLAASEGLSAEELERLSMDADPLVRREVAGNRGATAALLERLVKDDDTGVRERVAANPSSPGAVLAALAADVQGTVGLKVAGNPSLARESLEQMATSAASIIRVAAARNRALDRGLLSLLRRAGASRWLSSSGEARACLSEAELLRLASLGPFARSLAGASRFLTEPVALALLETGCPSARRALASNPASTPPILRSIAGRIVASLARAMPRTASSVVGLRLQVEMGKLLSNPSSPRGLSDELLSGDEPSRLALAASHGLDERLAEALSVDASALVREALALSRTVPDPLLARLAEDQDPQVATQARWNLARRGRAPRA